MKTQKNPDSGEAILFSSSDVPEDKRAEYEREVSKLRLGVNRYVEDLSHFIDAKVAK